jgi:hypothetical protein
MPTSTLPIHNCRVVAVEPLQLPDPAFGDMKLNVFPFEHTGEYVQLPDGYKMWEPALNKILERVPLVDGCNKHYITIDSKFFTVDDFLRREGVHIDGNFCADVNFSHSTWGGTRTTWGGTTAEPNPDEPENYNVITPWVSPYGIDVPFGTYVSGELGGIFCVASEVGCRAWDGVFQGEVGDEGEFSSMSHQLTNDREILFDKNHVYFMSSNTPHESLEISRGTRRTFMRLTLNHNYPNGNLLI